MSGEDEGNKRERLAVMLASGSSLNRASKELGIAYTTARRVVAKPGFKQRVKEIRDEYLTQTMSALTLLSRKAVKAMGDLLDSSDPELRFKAARAILSDTLAIREHADLAARLELLEGKLNGTA